MIAKISHSGNAWGTLTYNFDKINENEASVIATNQIRKGDRCSFNDALYSITQNFDEITDSRTKNTVTHISLNPAPEDVLTNQQMEDIAREYLNKMGYGDQPYIIIKHEDIKRHHLHIVTTGVKKDGKMLNRDMEQIRSKEISNEIERKYNLARADFSRDTNEIFYPVKVDAKKSNLKHQIKAVTLALEDFSFKSFNEYRSLLKLYNIDLEKVEGKAPNGKDIQGLLYKVLDNDGKPAATPIKSSTLGQKYGLKELEKRVQKSVNSDEYKKKITKTKSVLKSTMAEAKDLDDYLKKLNKKHIEVMLRKNDTGRIVGATIVDFKEKLVANGSNIDRKDFTANVFENLSKNWNAEQIKHVESEDIKPIDQAKTESHSFEGSVGMIDLPTFRSYGSTGRRKTEDVKEEKRKRKKKKPIVYYRT